MRVLVTGATGFVGAPLIKHLRDIGCDVVAATRAAMLQPSVAVGDIHGSTDWSDALTGCGAVVHTAARVHVMRETSSDSLREFRVVNVDGSLNLARQAAAAGVRRFVFLSTVKVNGESSRPGHPFLPDDMPAPEDAYGISKLEAELALKEVCLETGMEFVVIRPPLVYGPGVRGNFLSMVRWIKRGVPLPLGAISNSRSLVALDNLVDFITVCLEHPAAANQVFLVSDGEAVSTTEMLRKIARAHGVASRLIPVPPRWLRRGAAMLGKSAAADRLLGSLVVDNAKAREILGWKPVVTMDEQLRKMARDDSHS
ncbi:MAG: SDR family oxidoreductase [Rhodocyclaceae bacterium]|nr:SDR family oxidoreductase [Rhodocyclaceae bacterium]